MTNQRFDIYRLIHKGLRAYLTDTLMTIGRMDAGAEGELRQGLQQLRGLLAFCQSHLEHENTFVHTAMEQVQPGCTLAMANHHRHHEELIEELRQQVAQLEQAPVAEREILAADLYRNLAMFIADNLAHMHEEETANNRILWAGYSDDEIRAIEFRIVSSLSPEENAETTQWMLSAMNHQERHRFLREIRQAAPEFVFAGTLAIARQQLAGGEWRRLELALAS